MRPNARALDLREFKLEVTYRCNLNCVHCSSDAGPGNQLEMTREDCLRILADGAQMGAVDVAFSGGEPLLWPHLDDAVASAAHHRLSVTVYTSGNADAFEQRAAQLLDLGATRFIFSVFGATATSHERVTRKAGSFDRTKTAVQSARRLGLAAEVHFVPMQNNYRDVVDIAKLARQLGASRISVLRLVPQGRAVLIQGRALNRVQNLELRRLVHELREEYGKDFIRTGSPYNFLMVNDRPSCSAGTDKLIIGPDLRLYPCDAFKRIDASSLVGTESWSRLSSAKSLTACWRTSPYLKAVRTYLATSFAEPCASCKMRERCLSGCLAQKAIAYGSLAKRPDPDCLATDLSGEVS